MPAFRTRALSAGEKIRVLVVDDSVVIRRLVCHALEEDPQVDVAGVASNGVIALERIAQLNPDVITLDIEMPEMDGLELLRRLRRTGNLVRVVMFSTLTARGASATLDALALGADDYVAKASNAGSLDVSLASLRQQLIPKIHQFFRLPRQPSCLAPAPCAIIPANWSAIHADGSAVRAVGIGISTGGPAALAAIVPQLPTDLALPLFIVQHMPPLFTRFLAERLDALTPLAVREAVNGEVPQPGRVYIAPGDFHMRVVCGPGGVQIALDQGPTRNSCRPAVDVLFESMADVYRGRVVAAVLTGMGQDGLRGAQRLRAEGAYILAQDESSSVVWGMPGAVVNAGAADEVVPLDAVASSIGRRLAAVPIARGGARQ